MLNDVEIPAGSSILLDSVGHSFYTNASDPGGALVCVTDEVNPLCCRRSDGQNVGEWVFPNGSFVPRQGRMPWNPITRTGFTQQVRLNVKYPSITTFGEYRCVVPDQNNVTVSISIYLGKSCLCVHYVGNYEAQCNGRK